MTPFEHTVTLMKMHRPLGEREAVFMHTPALNALPRRTYLEGKLIGENGVVQAPKWQLKWWTPYDNS